MNDAYLLNTLQKPTNEKYKQTKSNNKLKHVHFSPIIFVKLGIQAGKKDRQSKNILFNALVNSGDSEYIITKAKEEKLPLKKTEQLWQWLIDTSVLTTNTKTETSFIFHELHANKLINQSLHIVDLDIYCYDIIISRYLISSLGIDIQGADMNIHWYDDAIPWRDIDSTTNNVFALS